MKVVDIANEIFLENASPSDTTIPAIAFWIRSNVGKLNTVIYEDFYVDTTDLEIHKCKDWLIGSMGASIIKMLFKIYRIDLDSRNMMVAVQYDTVLKATDQDFSIEKVNKSELLKTFANMKKDALKELQDLVHSYRSYYGEPKSVNGDDDIPGHFAGVYSQYTRNVIGGGGEYSNTIWDGGNS